MRMMVLGHAMRMISALRYPRFPKRKIAPKIIMRMGQILWCTQLHADVEFM
jgi:hypothetical protein